MFKPLHFSSRNMTPDVHFDGQSNGPQSASSEAPHTLEDMKAFLHARNKTGVIGDSQWHEDVKVHELWDRLSVPEASGKWWQSSVLQMDCN